MSDEPVVEDPPEEPPVRWGLGEPVAGYLAAFVLSNLVAGIWYGVTGREKATLSLVIAILASQWLVLVTAAVLTSRLKGTGSLSADFGLRLRGPDVVAGVACGLLSHVLVWLLYLPVRVLNPDLDLTEEARELTDLARGPGLVILAVCLVAGAPLVEELFFRGLLQRALDRRFGPAWAVAVSSLAFGVTHYQPLQFLGLMAFGAVLGLLAQRSGRLGAGIVAHATFNAATVVVLVAAR